jgi:putative membrane protein
MQFLFKLAVKSLAVLFVTWLLSSHVHLDSVWTACWVAASLVFLDTLVKPLMILLTIPVTFLTLGLFLFVINAFMVLIADYFVEGFHVKGFGYALIFSVLYSFFSSALEQVARLLNRSDDND